MHTQTFPTAPPALQYLRQEHWLPAVGGVWVKVAREPFAVRHASVGGPIHLHTHATAPIGRLCQRSASARVNSMDHPGYHGIKTSPSCTRALQKLRH